MHCTIDKQSCLLLKWTAQHTNTYHRRQTRWDIIIGNKWSSSSSSSSTEDFRGYCTPNCTGSMCLSESCTSSASWYTVAYTVRRRSIWSTSAYQSPTSLLGSISGPPVDDSWSFRDTGCWLQTYGRRAFSVAGPSAWNSLPDNLRDSSVSRDSFRKLLKSYLFTRYWNIERIRGFTWMRYTNLLTYLLCTLLINSRRLSALETLWLYALYKFLYCIVLYCIVNTYVRMFVSTTW